MHFCIHAYIHTCIHTQMLRYTCVFLFILIFVFIFIFIFVYVFAFGFISLILHEALCRLCSFWGATVWNARPTVSFFDQSESLRGLGVLGEAASRFRGVENLVPGSPKSPKRSQYRCIYTYMYIFGSKVRAIYVLGAPSHELQCMGSWLLTPH